MRITVLSFMLLLGSQAWANDTILKCRFAKKGPSVSFNVTHLVSAGCKGQTFRPSAGEFSTQYQITVCGGNEVRGVTEILTSAGEWVAVREFSNQRNGGCILEQEFRPIETNYPCRPSRYGHRGGCE